MEPVPEPLAKMVGGQMIAVLMRVLVIERGTASQGRWECVSAS